MGLFLGKTGVMMNDTKKSLDTIQHRRIRDSSIYNSNSALRFILIFSILHTMSAWTSHRSVQRSLSLTSARFGLGFPLVSDADDDDSSKGW